MSDCIDEGGRTRMAAVTLVAITRTMSELDIARTGTSSSVAGDLAMTLGACTVDTIIVCT